ncbi:hypothetical protein LTR53_013037 [Teratosphaeriaceae sp. CCFEE 6253]|nr:hypothetical protein LTR53_013037 [Teratosphaeriaceae sp. CCFEE 6253]
MTYKRVEHTWNDLDWEAHMPNSPHTVKPTQISNILSVPTPPSNIMRGFHPLILHAPIPAVPSLIQAPPDRGSTSPSTPAPTESEFTGFSDDDSSINTHAGSEADQDRAYATHLLHDTHDIETRDLHERQAEQIEKLRELLTKSAGGHVDVVLGSSRSGKEAKPEKQGQKPKSVKSDEGVSLGNWVVLALVVLACYVLVACWKEGKGMEGASVVA